MNSSSPQGDISNISLGERRGKADLARSSLDLSWARAATDSARSRAYPSPPMSGSPPIPPGRNPDSSDRSHGSYGSGGQDVYRGTQPPHTEAPENMGQPVRAYPADQAPPPAYFAPFRMDMPAGQLQYHQQQPFMVPQQQHQQQQPFSPLSQHPNQTSAGFPTPDRAPIREGADYTSPKNQRKTKGHVASACVPCKKAHLRCDAQRPCSRCMSNGKEDTCVDVQHKKRGRPRLRDERESRYENLGTGYSHPQEPSMRRPVSFYGPGPGESSIGTPFGDSLQRSGSYRVLKSQGPSPGFMGGPIAPRYIDQALQDANMYGSLHPAPRSFSSQEPLCAYLNMEMQFTKTTQSFAETVGITSIVPRKLLEVVVGTDHEKVMRLQRVLDEDRRETEPNYLPPIHLRFEEDSVIQSVGFGPEELGQIRLDRPEMLTFQAPDGQQRSFQVRLGLGKKESTYFIVMVLYVQPPQHAYQPPAPQYSRETYPREQQYSFQPPQQQHFMQHSSPSSYSPAQGFDSPTSYRPPGHMGSNAPVAPSIQGYAQPPRQDYAPPPPQYQPPPQAHPQYQQPRHGEMHPGQVQRQRDLQLPPIRDQRGENPVDLSRRRDERRDERSGRVDIGGLIEKPDLTRRGGGR